MLARIQRATGWSLPRNNVKRQGVPHGYALPVVQRERSPPDEEESGNYNPEGCRQEGFDSCPPAQGPGDRRIAITVCGIRCGNGGNTGEEVRLRVNPRSWQVMLL